MNRREFLSGLLATVATPASLLVEEEGNPCLLLDPGWYTIVRRAGSTRARWQGSHDKVIWVDL